MHALFVMALSVVSATANALPATMPPSEVHAGQRGECRTVFVGEAVEPVPFEVRGVLPDYLGPAADLIVIRLLGEKAEFSGVAAGMSGSPCSIDGRVIGALSYSFMQFGKEPIAGVTPIADMLTLLELPDEPLPWRQEGVAPAPRRSVPRAPSRAAPPLVERALQAYRQAPRDDWRAFVDGAPSPQGQQDIGDARPIATPLTLSGLSPALAQRHAPYFLSHGFALAAGTSARKAHQPEGDDAARAPRIVPGGSVAGVLVHGDIDVAGTGTVSWVQDGRVLAFGHPFFGVGPVSMPMAEAHIVQILASSQHSRKMPITGRMVGEFSQDRLSAIGGKLGPVPAMVRVSGVMHTGKHAHPISFEVVRDPFWTPRFVAMGLQKVFDGRVLSSQRGTLRTEAIVRFDGEQPLSLSVASSAERDTDLHEEPANDIASAFAALWISNDTWPGNASIDLNVTFSPEAAEEHIETLRLGQAIAAPRAQVPVVASLRAAGREAIQQTFDVTVPVVPDGEPIMVLACEGSLLDALDDLSLGTPPLQRRSQWRRWLAGRRTPGELYVQLRRLEGRANHAQGQRLVNLPPSAAASLTESVARDLGSVPVSQASLQEHHVRRPGAVRGCAAATFTVQRAFASAVRAQSR